MEQNQSTPVSGLGIDTSSKFHLAEAARWAKFLSIVGFVVCGLVVILGIFAGSLFSSQTNKYASEFEGMNSIGSGIGSAMAIIYIVVAILYFFPCLFLFRFANLMKAALAIDEQDSLIRSFQNLKKMFRYVGILTIVILTLYLILFLIVIAGAATMGI